MDNVAVGTDTSQQSGSEVFFQAYQGLLRQKEKIDKELLKIQSKFLKAISRHQGIIQDPKAKYVPRLKNMTTLASAIRECMIPNSEMSMEDILQALSGKNLYHTDSKYFYTMVNNKLNRDPLIQKVSRGIFVFKPRKKKKSAVA